MAELAANEEEVTDAEIDAMWKARQARGPFLPRLRRAAEEGVLLFVKHLLVVALWAGTGFLLWREVAIVMAQARAGQLASQYLQQNYKEINALVEARKSIDAAVAKADAPKK